MKRKPILTIVFLILITVSTAWSAYKNNSIDAQKQSSVNIDITGRYFYTIFMGDVHNRLYYIAVSTQDTESPVVTDLTLICTDKESKLIFKNFIENGSSYGTKIIKDKIYVPILEERAPESNHSYQVYDLDGNQLETGEAPGNILNFVELKDNIYAIISKVPEGIFDSYLWNIDGSSETIEAGSGYIINNSYTLPDGVVILLGYKGSFDQEFVSPDMVTICRFDENKIIRTEEIPKMYFDSMSPFAASGTGLLIGAVKDTPGKGLIDIAYLVDSKGYVTRAHGVTTGLKSWRRYYRFQLGSLFSDYGYWDILLLNYKYRPFNSETSYNYDYILRLNSDGNYISRKLIRFSQGRNIIGILEGEENKRIFLTEKPSGNTVELEIFVEK